ncbi:MAG: ComEC/Rec2 family competence protein, partial [Ectothiorhodospiraceae bacterium]
MIALLAGATLVLYAPYPEGQGFLLAAVMASAFLFAPGRLKVLGWLGLGVLWSCAWTVHAMEARLPGGLEGKTIRLTGRVIGLPERSSGRERFLVEPDSLEGIGGDAPLPRRIRLSWYRAPSHVRPGERWRWTVRLRRPRGLMNPVRFDYERWLFSRRIDAVGYVRREPPATRLAGPRGLDWLRDRWSRGLLAAAGPGEAVQVLRALVLGDRRGFKEPLWKTFRRTGTSHLVAISGLHVGLLAALGFLLGRRLWALLPAAQWWPSQLAGAGTAVGMATAYAALAGFSLPTRRALIMIGVALVAIALRRRLSPSRGLGLAAVGVLLLDPFAPLAPGFWLSFGAVAVLLAASSGRGGARKIWQRAAVAQLSVTVGLTPLVIGWFGRLSLLAVPVNLAAVPIVGLVVVPAALATVALWLLSPGLGAPLVNGLADSLQ